MVPGHTHRVLQEYRLTMCMCRRVFWESGLCDWLFIDFIYHASCRLETWEELLAQLVSESSEYTFVHDLLFSHLKAWMKPSQLYNIQIPSWCLD